MAKLSMMIKCTLSAIRFDGHGGPAVQYEVHFLMQHVQGYLGSHWTLPLGDYSLCIAPVATRATGKQTPIYKYTYKSGHFNGFGNAPVRNRGHSPMEEIQGFTRSHWMPPLGEYYVRYHKRDMAMPVFLYVSIVKTIEKGRGLMLRPLFSIRV